jgi:thymidylate synthase
MQPYHQLIARILDEGIEQQDRTGVGTLSIFGQPTRHDQEASSALDHHRAALVSARRNQRRMAQGEQGQDLGRMGRRERRPRSGLRQAVA